MKRFYRRFLALRNVSVPVIAAINGHAIGAGYCVALACDGRVAFKDANVAVNFVRLGIHPGMGATFSIPRLAGLNIAQQFILTGQTVTAAKAHQMNMITTVVDTPDAAKEEAIKLATTMATASAVAVRQTLITLRGSDEELERALDREARAQAVCYAQKEDLREALVAIKERRAPVFV